MACDGYTELVIGDRSQLEAAIDRRMQSWGWTAYDPIGLCKTYDLVGRFTRGKADEDVISLVEFAADTVYTGRMPDSLTRQDRRRPMPLRVWVGLRYPLADQFVAKILGRAWHGCITMREIGVPDDILYFPSAERDVSKKIGDIAEALVALSEAQTRVLVQEVSSVEKLCSEVRCEIEDPPRVASVGPPKPAPGLLANGADRHISLIGMLVCAGREGVAREELGKLIRLEGKDRKSHDRHYFIEGMKRLLDKDVVSDTLRRWDVCPLAQEPDALLTLFETEERQNAFEALCRKARGMSEEDVRVALEEVETERGFAKEPLAVEFYVTRAMDRVSVTRLRSICRRIQWTKGASDDDQRDRSVIEILQTNRKDVALHDLC